MAWQFAPGEILTATNLNAVTKPWNAVCQVRMSAPQSLTSGSLTTLLFDTEDLDARTWHSTVTNTGRITPTVAGWYEATATGAMASDGDYTRLMLSLSKNGSATTPSRLIDFSPPTGTVAPGITLAGGLISLNGSTDYLEISARQTNTSAGANTIDASFTVRLVYPT